MPQRSTMISESLERLFGEHDTSNPQCRPVQNIGPKEPPAHVGTLIAAKPRILGMIRDTVRAGLLPEQILETRLPEVIETAVSTYTRH